MKVLAVSDVPAKALWDHYDGERLKGYDLILSCGDLPAPYLSFLVTIASCPLLYVHGNHDGKYRTAPPEGCICVEDRIFEYEGIKILGLGGSLLYSGEGFQYTERQMTRRIRHQRLRLFRSKGVDILLTHAPARGVDDGADLPHQGFSCFTSFLDTYRPRLMVHGHMHLNYGFGVPRTCRYKDTTVINACERYVFEL